jgi:GNAT superfamily N-acetyltransferase
MRLARFDAVAPSREQRRRFSCGQLSLDRWLATQAGQSMRSRDAVTYLSLDDEDHDRGPVGGPGGDHGEGEGAPIAGYFCLAAGAVAREATPGAMGRRAPEPIPAVRMGRFAVDRRYQGQGWGADLLREALVRAASGGQVLGARALLVDALDDRARSFYLGHGFEPSPIHPDQLLFDLRTVPLVDR